MGPFHDVDSNNIVSLYGRTRATLESQRTQQRYGYSDVSIVLNQIHLAELNGRSACDFDANAAAGDGPRAAIVLDRGSTHVSD